MRLLYIALGDSSLQCTLYCDEIVQNYDCNDENNIKIVTIIKVGNITSIDLYSIWHLLKIITKVKLN